MRLRAMHLRMSETLGLASANESDDLIRADVA